MTIDTLIQELINIKNSYGDLKVFQVNHELNELFIPELSVKDDTDLESEGVETSTTGNFLIIG